MIFDPKRSLLQEDTKWTNTSCAVKTNASNRLFFQAFQKQSLIFDLPFFFEDRAENHAQENGRYALCCIEVDIQNPNQFLMISHRLAIDVVFNQIHHSSKPCFDNDKVVIERQ